MPFVLSLETATRAGSLAITRGQELLASRTGDAQVSHSTNLLDQIKSALDEAGLKLSEIDYFAVATGPGSFTGLRIGLATDEQVEITSGLSEGQLVVTGNTGGLIDGQVVQPQVQAPLTALAR